MDQEGAEKVAMRALGLYNSLKASAQNVITKERAGKIHQKTKESIEGPQFDGSSKAKHRRLDLSTLPDTVMDHVHKGVGTVRTDAFDVDRLFDVYPSTRYAYNHADLVSSMERPIGDATYSKA